MYSFGLHGISPSDTMILYVALFMQGYIIEGDEVLAHGWEIEG
jgi:hypothetical protein